MTHKILWYLPTLRTAFGENKNPGTVEIRVRSYFHRDGVEPVETDARNEESFRATEEELTATAKERGDSTWDERDLRIAAARLLEAAGMLHEGEVH